MKSQKFANSVKNAVGTVFLLAGAFFVCSTMLSIRAVFADPIAPIDQMAQMNAGRGGANARASGLSHHVQMPVDRKRVMLCRVKMPSHHVQMQMHNVRFGHAQQQQMRLIIRVCPCRAVQFVGQRHPRQRRHILICPASCIQVIIQILLILQLG